MLFLKVFSEFMVPYITNIVSRGSVCFLCMLLMLLLAELHRSLIFLKAECHVQGSEKFGKAVAIYILSESISPTVTKTGQFPSNNFR